MKKARTLLAIWLALILTLTLFPTALADGGDKGTNPDPNGGAATFQPQQVYVDLTNAKITDLNPGQQFNSSEDGATITFKIAEGYEWDFFQVFVTGTDHVADKCTLTVDETTGVYKLTIPAEVITNKVVVKLFTEKAATPSTDTEGDGSDDDHTPPSTPQGGDDSNLDEGDPDGSGTPTKPEEYTITLKIPDGFDSSQVGNFPNGITTFPVEWSTDDKKLSLPANLTYPGFTFKGWANGNNEVLTGKETFTADTTLTAKFVRNYTFTFAGLDGITSTTPTLESAAPGSEITLPAAPTARGKEFKHWSISGDGITTTTVGANGTFPLPAGEPQEGKTAITITAIWSDLPKITINFQPEAGAKSVSGIPNSDTSYANEVYQLPNNRPSRHDGSYEFASWQLNVGGTTYNFQPGNSVDWSKYGIKDGTTVTFIADFDHHYYADYDEDDDKPSKPSKPTYDEYRIRATCSDGGWVSPAGSTYVREGRNLTVTFAPWNGYAIDGVYIDGVLDNRYDGSYTFRDVDENHTIYVRYVRDSGSSGGSSGGGSHWDDDTSPKTGDTSAPLSMGLGVGSLALIAFLVARKMRRA